MFIPKLAAAAGGALFLVLAGTGSAMAEPSADPPPTGTLVTVGSPASPFSQNKQNEPAVAIDAHNPSVVVAGSNDNIDAMKERSLPLPGGCWKLHASVSTR